MRVRPKSKHLCVYRCPMPNCGKCFICVSMMQQSFEIIVFFFQLNSEEYNGILAYNVPAAKARKWSTVFGVMEKATRNIQIEDYIVSQTTLEQIFLSFTKNKGGGTINKKLKKRRRRRLPNVRRIKF